MKRIALAAVLLLAGCAGGPTPVAVGEPEPAPIKRGRVPPPGPYAPGFDALHYAVSLELALESKSLTGTTRIDLLLTEPESRTLRLDFSGLRALRVTRAVNRKNPDDVDFRQDDGRLILESSGSSGDTLHIEVTYAGQPDDGLIMGNNVHGRAGAFGDNWPDRARFWFPAIDHPSDKATVEFAIKVAPGYEVIANGMRVGAVSRMDAPSADGIWRWRIDQPIPTYLMVIGVSQFAVASVNACAKGGTVPPHADGCVPVEYWVFPEDSANGARLFQRAGQMLEYYSTAIAPYPYQRLAHVQSSTIFGGMENAGAIFYSEKAIQAGTLGENTVAHETAHQWFGDAVTPAHWSHVWLSEGFATYFGNLFFEQADGVARFREITATSWKGYFGSDVKDLAIVDSASVPGNDLVQLLNANSYNKGGAVLHMARGLLGDEVFFNAIRRYYRQRIHGNARTPDLQRALEQESGRDLDWFFQQWVYRPGYPILTSSYRWDAAANEVEVSIVQTQKDSWPTFRFPLDLSFTINGGDVRRRIEVAGRRETIRIKLPAAPTALQLDPDGWLLHEKGQ